MKITRGTAIHEALTADSSCPFLAQNDAICADVQAAEQRLRGSVRCAGKFRTCLRFHMLRNGHRQRQWAKERPENWPDPAEIKLIDIDTDTDTNTPTAPPQAA